MCPCRMVTLQRPPRWTTCRGMTPVLGYRKVPALTSAMELCGLSYPCGPTRSAPPRLICATDSCRFKLVATDVAARSNRIALSQSAPNRHHGPAGTLNGTRDDSDSLVCLKYALHLMFLIPDAPEWDVLSGSSPPSPFCGALAR